MVDPLVGIDEGLTIRGVVVVSREEGVVNEEEEEVGRMGGLSTSIGREIEGRCC